MELCRAGALGVLDLGRDPAKAAAALAEASTSGVSFGVRIPEGVSAPALPEGAEVVVVSEGTDPAAWPDRRVLVQVTSAKGALAAERSGAYGVIAKGSESGGRVGEASAFVLLQQVVQACTVPVWLQGGIGVHSAAAAIVGGARGVVLDGQLALLEESCLPQAIETLVGGLDGSETTVANGYRVFHRPDLPVGRLAEELPDSLGPGPLDTRLLPVGQDAALAQPLATRYPRALDLVRGLNREIDGHRGQAVAAASHAPGSAFARDHGLRYPIVQGPMSRVSDTAAFAEAVARAGALPFLALSVSGGEALRAMLSDTRDRLRDLPWGVGMLGFAPPEVRADQLAAVRDVRPPVALLAGGRPAQARELEEAGVPTYLHVPSPGLLDLFLAEGARRFVFEGRECGGHVGPRSSFVLWDQFVERLLDHDAPHELSLLFAGGIHDARSAAMVSALAAPLAVRGARIGLLMGTAYLFTEEAVSTGAITRAFQQAALDCDNTVLVHSAPGHATRCVDSPFVDAFADTRRRLEDAGEAPEAVWEALERLNLGRLRLAAKGIRRDGERLVEVDEDTQRREGLFMIGQVATLEAETTTLAALHREVSEGPDALLSAPSYDGDHPALDIAIVGMGGFFPGAPDLEAFWSNVVLGRDAITEVPPERWNPDLYYDPDAKGGERSISKWGGFLPPIDFDPLHYGIPPRSLAAVEPVQLLALEAARRALADAGYAARPFDRERTSVVFGAEAGTDLAAAYGFRALYPQYLGEMPPELDDVLPRLTEDSFPGVLANVIAGRIANRLDLGGVNYTVDAACASSLAALDVGCKELAAGTSDMVLVGGADLHNAIGDYLLFTSVHALSPTGRSRPFDADADGIGLGEGVAVVVCKRLADAERDGDRIYAVVKGIAGASDGRSLGLTAPHKEGQVRALERAHARAGISPAQVGLVEAHGTGTVVGDRTELATLTEVYTRAGVRPGQATLGSVKSNIGHTKCAAGLAGLVKVTLALHHQVLPPTLHIVRPNPAWRAADSPFVFRSHAAPWNDEGRHAAVSAFGFGGTNFHAVLAAHGDTPVHGLEEWPAELFLFRQEADLERLAYLLATDPPWRLRDLAAAVAKRGEGPVRVAVVAENLEDLREKLIRALHGRDSRGVFWAPEAPVSGKLAFLFPGQGSQRPGMLAELFVAFPGLQELLGPGWRERLYPGDTWEPAERKAQRARITDTRVAQPALGMVDLATAQVLRSLGVEADQLAGHSYGELVALCVAGALRPDELTELSETRGRVILEAAAGAPGAMASAGAPATALEPVLEGIEDVVLANHNSPFQTVLSGTEQGIATAAERLEAEGIEVRRVPVACAFHSPVVAGAREGFAAALEQFQVRAPQQVVYANSTARPYATTAKHVRRALAEHVVRPVRFADQLEAMYEAGARVFVEVGPGRVLTRFVEQTLGEHPHLALSLEDPRGGGALEGLVRLLAHLAVAGIPLQLGPLFEGRGIRPVDLDAPMPVPSPTLWRVNGQRAWPREGVLPDFAMKVLQQPLSVAYTAKETRDQVVLEYLRTLREQAETQRQVMLSYLGEGAPEVDALAPIEAAIREITGEAPLPTATTELDTGEVLLNIVADRTGYPHEMLDLDLDLESDLSIDSIKRIEILGALYEGLGQSLGLDVERERLVEELAGIKTLRGILAWIADRTDADLEQLITEELPKEQLEDGVPEHTLRFVPELEELAPPSPGSLAHLRVGIVGDVPGLAEALLGAALAEGARARILESDASLDDLDVLVALDGLGAAVYADLGDRLFALSDLARRALLGGVERFVVVTGQGGSLGQDVAMEEAPGAGVGVSGLLKAIAKEWPLAKVQRVDLALGEDLGIQVSSLLSELEDTDGPVEVGYRAGRRLGVRFVARELDNGLVYSFGRDSVFLLTGGARGITARVSRSLAERYGGTVVLAGRSPVPESLEDSAFAGADDVDALRARVVALGEDATPAAVEARVRRLMADREMRETFAAIRASGARLDYHVVDVRDRAAVRGLVERVYREYGRIDAVVHGAGVNEDKLLRHKEPDSFRRVFDTKVQGALNLTESLPSDVGVVVFFSSVAGAFGSRGQVDYAAANDTLDQLARGLDACNGGRTLSIDWGPWGGGGMVTPELEGQYARRGIGLIDPAEGVRRLLDELESGQDAQVVLMQARPQQMA
jgi:acyl transferase domain-containing protein/NAD(P)H-dependent flavin oxidoreductase YrpB (nitropropane dioxygenase family)